MRKRLGCLSGAGLATAALTALTVILFVLVTGGRLFSPGPLNAEASGQPLGGVNSHAEIGGRCAGCHAPPWGAEGMSERCLACHTAIDAGIRDETGLHGALLARDDTLRCYDCHQEHQGKAAPLTVVDPHRFPHDATGYSLRRHQELPAGEPFACAHCHGEDLTRFEQSACLICHTELERTYMEQHRLTFGVGCLSCHDGLDTYGRAFDHARLAFPLLGQHALADCAGCHQGARSPADLQGAAVECFACHQQDDAHAGGLTRDCGACHTPDAWEQATFEHDQTGFSLLGQHRQIDCVQCHMGQRFRDTPKECIGCHVADDPHETLLGQDCARCHTPVDWEQVAFDHSQSAFPLEGGHQRVDCDQCHQDSRFLGTVQDCFGCHREDDAHDGRFGAACGGCHTPLGWDQVTLDHNLTAFPLSGTHLQVDCLQCHVSGIFAGTAVVCVACHAEPAFHAGTLGTDCEVCHNTVAWLPSLYDRSHTFPLAHGSSTPSSCRTCHPQSLGVYTCYTCHEHDPSEIESEHVKEGISDFQPCVTCHPNGLKDEAEERGRDGDDDDD